MTGATEYLEDRFGPTFYRVPPSSADEFLALQRQAADVYSAHSLDWSLSRSHKEPEEWVEFGPRFREGAALERTAAALEDGDVLERLAAFRIDFPSVPSHADPDLARVLEAAAEGHRSLTVAPLVRVEDDVDAPVNAVIVAYSTTTADLEEVLSVGDGGRGFFASELPPIDPADMTPAMRRAQALARALAVRLDRAVPEPFSIEADQEALYLLYEGRRRMGGRGFVDEEPEWAIQGWLEQLQDEITEQLTVPWPHDPARGYEFHEPSVSIRDGMVHFGYGDVLAFEPIPLSELDG